MFVARWCRSQYLLKNTDGSYTFRENKFFCLRRYLYASVVVLSCCSIYLIGAVIFCSINKTPKEEISKYCLSKECLEAAVDYKISMDLNVDPCDDFYKYTCGKWSKDHPDNRWYSSYSAQKVIEEKLSFKLIDYFESYPLKDEPSFVKKARNLYDSCKHRDAMRDVGLSVVIETLKNVNLPIVPRMIVKNKTMTNESFNWLETEAKIGKTIRLNTVIKLIVTRNVYYMNVIQLSLPDSNTLLWSYDQSPISKTFKKNSKEQKRRDKRTAGRKDVNSYIFESVLNDIVKNVSGPVLDKQLIKEAFDIINNITEVMQMFTNKYEANEYYEYENDRTLSETVFYFQTAIDRYTLNNNNKTYPMFFSKFIEYVFQNTSTVFNPETDWIYINSKHEMYFSEVLSYLLELPDYQIELYMWWRLVYHMLPITIFSAFDLMEHRQKHISSPISYLCANLVDSYMKIPATYILASNSPNHKAKLEKMINEIKTVFTEEIKTVSWMDEETKNITITKSEEMLNFIGYPDWLFDNTAIEKIYENVTITSTGLSQNLINLIKEEYTNNLNTLRDINNRSVWDTTNINKVNAYNVIQKNALYIPIGFLNFPLYSSALEVLAYGSIGTTLGHELIHGFDNTGRHYGIYGEISPLFSNHFIENLTDCFLSQYQTIDGIEGQTEGIKSLGENLADNGGLRQAYAAYLKHFEEYGEEDKLPGFENFSNHQMFFIAYGSIWCETFNEELFKTQMYTDHLPKSIRLHGALQNSDAFAEVFKCPKGSKMNPEKIKCKLY